MSAPSTAPALSGPASGALLELGGALVVMPFPVAGTLQLADGWAVLLQAPAGIATPVSLLVLNDDRTVRWIAEPCAWPPQHDPYVEMWFDDGHLTARSASGWTIAFDSTGAGRIVGTAS